MKKLLPLLIATILFANTAYAAGFSDVPQTHDNYVAITFLNGKNILTGYSDGTFKPDQQVNRAEAVKILLTGDAAQVPSAVTQSSFTDVVVADWFARYVETAKNLKIIAGNPDGTFAPSRQVTRAEFLKMMLAMYGFNTEKWVGQQLFNDVPADAWYAPYMNYAGQAGLVTKDDKGNLMPSQALTRGQVAEIFYLMDVIRSGKDTQFLLDQSESEMAQVEIYIGAGKAVLAKRASELSVDMTQQAYKNMPDNNVVLGAAKLARAYDFLVNSFVSALQKKNQDATDWANQAIAKATEAWDANNALQPLAKHIKDRANEILAQITQA